MWKNLMMIPALFAALAGACVNDADCGTTAVFVVGTSNASAPENTLKTLSNKGVCDINTGTCKCNQGYRGATCNVPIQDAGEGFGVADDFKVYRYDVSDISILPTAIVDLTGIFDSLVLLVSAYNTNKDILYVYGSIAGDNQIIGVDVYACVDQVAATTIPCNSSILVDAGTSTTAKMRKFQVADDRSIIGMEYNKKGGDVLMMIYDNPLELWKLNVNSAQAQPTSASLSTSTEIVVGFTAFDPVLSRFFFVDVKANQNGPQLFLRKITGDVVENVVELPNDLLALEYSVAQKSVVGLMPSTNGVRAVVISTDSASVVGGTPGQVFAQTEIPSIDGMYLGVSSLVYDSMHFRAYKSAEAVGTSVSTPKFIGAANDLSSYTNQFQLLSVNVRPKEVGCDGTIGTLTSIGDWDCNGNCGRTPLCYANVSGSCQCGLAVTCEPGQFLDTDNQQCTPCKLNNQYSTVQNQLSCETCSITGQTAFDDNLNDGIDGNTACQDAPLSELQLGNYTSGLVAYGANNGKTQYFFTKPTDADLAADVPDRLCYKIRSNVNTLDIKATVVIGTPRTPIGLEFPTASVNAEISEEMVLPVWEADGSDFVRDACFLPKAFAATNGKRTINGYNVTIFWGFTSQSTNVGWNMAVIGDWNELPAVTTGVPQTGTTGIPATTGVDKANKDKKKPGKTTADDPLGGSNLFILIGAVVGCCIVVVIVVIILALVLGKKKKEKKEEEMATYGSITAAQNQGNYGAVDAAQGAYGSTQAAQGAYGSAAAAQGAYGSSAAAQGVYGGTGSVYGSSASSGSSGGSSGNSVYAPSILREVSIANAIDYRELEMSGKVLGSGAFGVVKMAMFRGRKVAVKEIKPDNVDERELKAFVEEAELMQQLDQHENVVGFIGVVVDPFCIVSEFMGKGDLNSYLMSDVAIPDMMKVKILLDIAKGMNFLAKQGIVHRDLAARNILLDDNMVAKVSDFGLSRLLDTESAVYTKSATGPVKWMAPEQLTKRKASEKSDVWMYGVLIFEVVTRGPPYPNMNLTEVCVSVANNQLRPIFPSNTPDLLVQLTDHIFQYDPNYRPTFADIVVRLSSSDDKGGYVLAN